MKRNHPLSKLRIALAGFKGNGLFIRGDDATNVNTAWPWSSQMPGLEIMVHGFYRQKVGLKTEVKRSVLPFTLVGHPVFYPMFQWSQTQNFQGTERRFSIANLNNKRLG